MKIYEISDIDIFYLWKTKYEYQFSLEDKKFFLQEILNLNEKDKNFLKKIKKIFIKILKKQNLKVDIQDNDLFWLLNYFLMKYL